MNKQTKRAELCAMTCYSGVYAFDTPETMIRRAKAAGCSAIAVTDIDTVRAFPSTARAAAEIGMKVTYGAQLTMINDGDDVHDEADWYHVTVLARDGQGLCDLYRLISRMIERGAYDMTYVTRSELAEHRAHLLIGSGGVGGEVYEALLAAKDEAICAKIAMFYDYIEICPPCGSVDRNGASEITHTNRWVVDLAEKAERPVVAVGYAEYAEKKDTVTANAIYYLKNRALPPIGYDLHLRTTEEMLKVFSFLGEETAYEVVVTNPQKLADKVEGNLDPLPLPCTAPYLESADAMLESAARRALRKLYGIPPAFLDERLENELKQVRDTLFSETYLIWRHIAHFCQRNGHPVSEFGPTVGLRFLSYLLGIHRLNPLPPHYRCPQCQHTEFLSDTDLFPFEMPPAVCPVCQAEMIADGYNLTSDGVPGTEIYTEVPTVIQKEAIEDLRAFLEKNGNYLFQQSRATVRDYRVKRLAEFNERRHSPLSQMECLEILKKCGQRRETVPIYYTNLFCAMRAEPLYTFGPVTTVNGRSAVGFDPEEWTVQSHIYFTVASPELDRLDELTNAAGATAGAMDFHDQEVFAALAAELPEEETKVPESFRAWMEVCKRNPQIWPFADDDDNLYRLADDRGVLYFVAWQKYRTRWLELHAPGAFAKVNDAKEEK